MKLRTPIPVALVILMVACGRTSLVEDGNTWPSPPSSPGESAPAEVDAGSAGSASDADDGGRDTEAPLRDDAGSTDAGASADIATACLVPDNAFVWSGGNATPSGGTVVVSGGPGWWFESSTTQDIIPVDLQVHLDVPGHDSYSVSFSTRGLGKPLVPGTYTSVQGADLKVQRNGGTCTTITGQFRVVEMSSFTSGDVKSFTATFEQFCDGETSASVGCVHFAQ